MGLATRADKQFSTEDGDSVYLSDDLMNGSGKLKEADVFALGISAYHLLLKRGSPPQSEYQTIREHGTLNFPSWFQNEKLQRLLLTMINPNPDERPTARQVQLEATKYVAAYELISSHEITATAATPSTTTSMVQPAVKPHVAIGLLAPTGVDVGLLSREDMLRSYQGLDRDYRQLRQQHTQQQAELQQRAQQVQQQTQRLLEQEQRIQQLVRQQQMQPMRQSAPLRQPSSQSSQQPRKVRTNSFGGMSSVIGFNSMRGGGRRQGGRGGTGSGTSMSDDIGSF